MFNKENFSKMIKNQKFEKTKELKYIKEKTKKEIFDFQKEKEEIMQKMHILLKKVEQKEDIFFENFEDSDEDFRTIIPSPNNNTEYSIKYREKNNKGVMKDKTGKITKGDIMIASIWHNTDIVLDKTIDRKTKKEFIIRESKRAIEDLWNKQLTLGIKDSREDAQEKSVQGLENSEINYKNERYEEMSSGHLAEKLVDSFFTKILTNNNFPFTIEQADVFEDTQNKIDFVFKIKNEYFRGLGVKTCEETEDEGCNNISSKNIGMQYTMNNKVTAHKQSQIDRVKKVKEITVDDIVLVTVPLDSLYSALEKWTKKRKKNNFSGPEKFLSDKNKENLFKTVLDKLPGYLKINSNEYWKKVKDQV